MSDLPSGFYRAEARWLEPPDEADDLTGDICHLFGLIQEKLEEFSASYCGEITPRTDINRIISASEALTRDLKEAAEAIDILESEITPDSTPIEEAWLRQRA